jgi:hypothetical protein
MAAPKIWGPRRPELHGSLNVSIFRRLSWANSTLTEAFRLVGELLVGDHRHGDLVAEEPPGSSIST